MRSLPCPSNPQTSRECRNRVEVLIGFFLVLVFHKAVFRLQRDGHILPSGVVRDAVRHFDTPADSQTAVQTRQSTRCPVIAAFLVFKVKDLYRGAQAR